MIDVPVLIEIVVVTILIYESSGADLGEGSPLFWEKKKSQKEEKLAGQAIIFPQNNKSVKLRQKGRNCRCNMKF